MRVSYLLQSLLFTLAISIMGHSQILNKVYKANNTVVATGSTISTTTRTVKTAKNALKGLFAARGSSNQCMILLTGVDFDDENPITFKKAVEKVKGVKDVSSNFKDNTVTIMVTYKGQASDIWDEIPKPDKEMFKLAEAGEKSLSLEYKTAKPAEILTGAGNTAGTVNEAHPSQSFPATGQFMAFKFDETLLTLNGSGLGENEIIAKLDALGKTLTIIFSDKRTNTGIALTLLDWERRIREGKYEWDRKKIVAQKSSYSTGTTFKQIALDLYPGNNYRYQFGCHTDPAVASNNKGSGYLYLQKFKPGKGNVVEGSFEFSFPLLKDSKSEEEIIHTIRSGKFRVILQ